MDSRQLGYFREIVECGSLTAAARRLGIAQPSLSQHVRNLEAHLGATLLMRTAKGVVPTEPGQVLYGFAVRVTDLLREAEGEVRNADAEPTGRVTFGLPASVSMALSVPLAETVRVELPRVQLCAIEAMSGHIKAWVAAGEIDIGLLYDREGLADCTSRLLLHERLHFYAAPDDWPFDTAPGSPVPLAALDGLDMILPSPGHGLRLLVERAAAGVGVGLRVVVEMDSLQQIKTLVARGSGHTVLSPAAVHDLASIGALVGGPIVEPMLRRPVWLVRSARRPVSTASRALEAICVEVIEDLVTRRIWDAEFA